MSGTRPGKAPHHSGDWQRRSAIVRARANADPNTRCWRCGQTYAEYAEVYGERAAAWQAGHTVDGDGRAPVLAEHQRCNSKAGAEAGNRRRNPSSGWV